MKKRGGAPGPCFRTWERARFRPYLHGPSAHPSGRKRSSPINGVAPPFSHVCGYGRAKGWDHKNLRAPSFRPLLAKGWDSRNPRFRLGHQCPQIHWGFSPWGDRPRCRSVPRISGIFHPPRIEGAPSPDSGTWDWKTHRPTPLPIGTTHQSAADSRLARPGVDSFGLRRAFTMAKTMPPAIRARNVARIGIDHWSSVCDHTRITRRP